MENNEIMTNEEVMETATEVATSNSFNGVKVAAGIGAVVLAGVAAYKGYKLIKAKLNAKKDAQNGKVVDADFTEVEEEKEEN